MNKYELAYIIASFSMLLVLTIYRIRDIRNRKKISSYLEYLKKTRNKSIK